MNKKGEYIFSFIVPVYNVADYVEQCIRSLYNQDIPVTDYEVIVVDDCSPDNSKDIVVALQSEFPNLQLISLTENMKLGSARNIGLKNASGKYIWFVDSDDYIQPNTLKRFVNELDNNELEILHFDYQVFNEDGTIVPYRVHYDLKTCTGAEFYFDSHELWWQKGVEVWRNVYRKSFLIENNFWFAEKVMYEDVDYSFKVFAKAKRVKHIDFAPYFYRNNTSSITQTNVTPMHLKYWLLLALRCDKLREFFQEDSNIDERFLIIIDEFIKYQLGCVIQNLRKFNTKNRRLYRSLVNKLNLASVRKYVSFKKYLFLKYPITIITLIFFTLFDF